MLYGLLVIIGLIALTGLWAIGVYNGLVKRKNLVAEGWSVIDTQLKRRANLIPNLVETVKGYGSHEKETLEKLTELRAKSLGAQTVEGQSAAENALTSALANLRVAVEAYPDLKANEN
ncbi:MAG: LemA family protein, partial [Pseudomonadota bacterium]